MKYPPCDLIVYRRNIYLGYSTAYLATSSLKWDVFVCVFFPGMLFNHSQERIFQSPHSLILEAICFRIIAAHCATENFLCTVSAST